MTIAARFTAISRPRACRTDTSINCQTIPAKASAKRPDMRLNYLISIWFSAAMPALRRFSPVCPCSAGRTREGAGTFIPLCGGAARRESGTVFCRGQLVLYLIEQP